MYVDTKDLINFVTSNISYSEEYRLALSSIVGFVPGVEGVKDLQEFVTGVDVLAGAELTPIDRVVSGLAVFVPFVSGTTVRVGIDSAKLEKYVNKASKSGKVIKGTGKTAQSTALQTYYPPNDGFLGEVIDDVLQPGTMVDRYGHPGGSYVAPVGTPSQMRALPPGTLDKTYNVYEVIEPINVKSGLAAPWFDQIGLGTQYKFDGKIIDLLESGKLKKVN